MARRENIHRPHRRVGHYTASPLYGALHRLPPVWGTTPPPRCIRHYTASPLYRALNRTPLYRALHRLPAVSCTTPPPRCIDALPTLIPKQRGFEHPALGYHSDKVSAIPVALKRKGSAPMHGGHRPYAWRASDRAPAARRGGGARDAAGLGTGPELPSLLSSYLTEVKYIPAVAAGRLARSVTVAG